VEATIKNVSSIKRILVVHDGTADLEKVAEELKKQCADASVIVRSGVDFTATDLLPADAFFFGCASPKPASFAELERVLKGINLAGKPCGLFALEGEKSILYLRSIVKDADLAVNFATHVSSSVKNLGSWVSETLKGR
jgi:hypothetical protein